MSKHYSIAEARDNFAAVIHELEAKDSIEITRRGRPVAVLLSKEAYDRLVFGRKGFGHAYKAYRKRVNLAELNIDPKEVFGGLRDRESGREIDL